MKEEQILFIFLCFYFAHLTRIPGNFRIEINVWNLKRKRSISFVDFALFNWMHVEVSESETKPPFVHSLQTHQLRGLDEREDLTRSEQQCLIPAFVGLLQKKSLETKLKLIVKRNIFDVNKIFTYFFFITIHKWVYVRGFTLLNAELKSRSFFLHVPMHRKSQCNWSMRNGFVLDASFLLLKIIFFVELKNRPMRMHARAQFSRRRRIQMHKT